MIYVNHFNPCWRHATGRWCYDWTIRRTEEFATFEAFTAWLVPLIKACPTYAEKELAPMYNFIHHRSAVESDEITLASLATATRKRNNQSNQVAMSMLALDFDSPEYSIEQFAAENADLAWVLHTTYNHLSEKKKGAECFRAFVPLATPLPTELLTADVFKPSVAPALIARWPKVDETCFQPDRAIFQPAFHPSRVSEVVWRTNEGSAFDWTPLPITPGRIKQMPTNKKPVKGVVGGTGKLLLGTMDLRRFFEDRGLYRAPLKKNSYHEVSCYEGSHTDDGAVIFEGDDYWGYKCQHQRCYPGDASWLKNLIIEREGEEALRPYCEAVPERTLADVIQRFKAKRSES